MVMLTREAEDFLATNPEPAAQVARPHLSTFTFEELSDPDFFADYEAGAFDVAVSQSASNIASR